MIASGDFDSNMTIFNRLFEIVHLLACNVLCRHFTESMFTLFLFLTIELPFIAVSIYIHKYEHLNIISL